MRPWLSRKRIFEIVMSGKSPRSVARTSPIDWWSPLMLSPARSRRAHVEGQMEPSDLDLVAVVERADVDPLAIDVRAVQRPGVAHDEAVAVADDLAVPARDRDVVEEHRGVRVPADARDVTRDDEVAARVRAARHVEHRAVARDGRHRGDLDGGVAPRGRLEDRTTRRAV